MWFKARDTLRRIADLGAERVTFMLENLNLPVDQPQLRLNLDLYDVQIGEGNLISWCGKCLPWIGEIQVADVPGRKEPGTGEINYSAIARALSEMGYRGPICMEAFA
jgi:hydroxypyruvate isomerase